MYKLRVKDKFGAGHFLPWHEKCCNQHGHTYHVEVVVGSETLDGHGTVVDLGYLKRSLGVLVDRLDHTNLNDRFPNPTAEVVAEWIYNEMETFLPAPVEMVEVTLWETEDGGVTYVR